MKEHAAPRLETRRARQFEQELLARARAWIPAWGVDEDERDFGRALLRVAALFSSEVAQRFDNAGEKMKRGFLDWLGIEREAARPARLPVVFKMADTAQAAVLAKAPVQLQADVNGAPVVLETEADVNLMPAKLVTVIGIDADADDFFAAPPGFTSLDPLEPLPSEWRVKTFAAGGQDKLQLDSELGLAEGTIVETDGTQYRLNKVDKDIVTVDPKLPSAGVQSDTVVRKVNTFAPFDPGARNLQNHAIYLGHSELLNIEAEALIHVVGAKAVESGARWEYWGKREPDDTVGWQTLEPSDPAADAASFMKPKGAIEPRKIGSVESRWIRAWMKKTGDNSKPGLVVDKLKLRINYRTSKAPCPAPENAILGPEAEAMANTTPLVLSEPFYPLGREPRQFDAFYLGSSEAFSKKGAEVQLCFEMANATSDAYTPIREGAFANRVFAGVGRDGALHLFRLSSATGALSRFPDRDPLRPPLPSLDSTPPQTQSRSLQTHCRAVSWSVNNDSSISPHDFFIAVAAGDEVWVWREKYLDKLGSGWTAHGRLGLEPEKGGIDDLVVLDPSKPWPTAALADRRLWLYDGVAWEEVQPTHGGNPIQLVALVPVLKQSGSALASGIAMVGVSGDGYLFDVRPNGVCTKLPITIGPGERTVHTGSAAAPGAAAIAAIRPAAVRLANHQLVVVAINADRDHLVAFRSIAAEGALGALEGDEIPLTLNSLAASRSVECGMAGDKVQFSVTCAPAAGPGEVVAWLPFDAEVGKVLFNAPPPPTGSDFAGAPAMIANHAVAPGTRGEILLGAFHIAERRQFTKPLADGVIVALTSTPFVAGDVFVVDLDDNTFGHHVLAAPGLPRGAEVLHVVDPPFGVLADPPNLRAYRSSEGRAGRKRAAKQLELELGDVPTPGMVLLVKDGAVWKISVVTSIVAPADPTTDPYKAVVDETLPGPVNSVCDYLLPSTVTARLVPVVRFNPAIPKENFDAAVLERSSLLFPGAEPTAQHGTPFGLAAGNRPEIVALEKQWSVPPAQNAFFVLDLAFGPWKVQLADTASNPALSWEYWNGKGWWSLDVDQDGTQRLANTGSVNFTVPEDIEESDWAGKKNFWIRARLVGGDYGREEVKVIQTPTSNGGFEQKIERSSEHIRAPQVLDVHISYSIRQEVFPNFVLAEDSDSIRDQSDANRTPGAIVEAFVPLALTLGRLSGAALNPTDAATDCPPPCDCEPKPTTGGLAAGPSVGPPMQASVTPASGRALFLGFDKALADASVRVLLAVEEQRDFDELAPLDIAAFVGGRFVPIAASDDTRALSETGLITLAFGEETTSAALFGGARHWLRVTPRRREPRWKPKLRGAYVNGVWASATETLTRELLGSSEGAPNLVVQVARPPVLRNTLELRVREPLADEERNALLEKDPAIVLQPENLPGDWVLWKKVSDPADEGPTDRVYSLDEGTGEIRFGDGRHGAIPPVGRDSIVAFRYARTEAPVSAADQSVPANAIVARGELNLVSPVETVEAVFAADRAAGGAPPESDERVLRFGTATLRHRGRAVTARDFEDIALQSSPDIVQACVSLHRGKVRLVVVMRGERSSPDRAQVRELASRLLEAAPAALDAEVFSIVGPKVRRIRIRLNLRVTSLDHAGALTKEAKDRLETFFNTAEGGVDGDGFPLGSEPLAEEIAQALIGADDLEGIKTIEIVEILDDGSERPWSGRVRPHELVALAKDGVRTEFELVGAIA